MRDPEPEGRHEVVSIVDQLERRAIARMRAQAAATHIREAEASVERFEGTRTIKETDYDALITEIEGRDLNPGDVRVARAKLRATRALQSCLRGDPEAGFAEWAEVIAEAPELSFPYLVRGRWRMITDLASALPDYDRAAEVEPAEPMVYWRRGDCLAAMGDQDRALANYRRALALDPTSIDELQTMAKLLAARGEHADAARAYDRAIALAPRYVDFYLGRASAREALGDFEGAARDHGRIIEIDPSRLLARFSRAHCLGKAGHLERAIEEMERLVVLEPDDHHNHRTLGKMYFDAKRPREAVQHLSRAIELAPDDDAAHAFRAYAHAFRAYAHMSAGDPASSLADFERACALEPDEPGHLVGRALARSIDAPRAESRAELDSIIARFPDCRTALQQRGSLLLKDGEYELAVADLDRAVALAPDEVELLVLRARALGPLGRTEQALADAARAIELDPEHAVAHALRGVFGNHLEHDPAQVQADHDRAVELAPDNPHVLATRAEHLQDLEKHTAAIADYDRAIAVAPKAPSLYHHRGYSRSHLDEEFFDDEDWDEDPEATKARLLSSVEDFERAIELGLRTDEVFLELYNAHCGLEDLPAALAALDRGLEALPDAGILIRFRHQTRKSLGDLEGAAADQARGEALGMKFNFN
jgi:tetratricopeptide (TPR) repeat protein